MCVLKAREELLEVGIDRRQALGSEVIGAFLPRADPSGVRWRALDGPPAGLLRVQLDRALNVRLGEPARNSTDRS